MRPAPYRSQVVFMTLQLKISFLRPRAGGATTDSYNKDGGGQLSVRFIRAEAAKRACHASSSPVPPGRARQRLTRDIFIFIVSADVSYGLRRRKVDGSRQS
ncbi:MAG: hypothetical protein ACK526_13950 [Planctomyces sp.]|jgi:acyl-coenzyme A thioesterase PaaI-like protein